MSGIATGFNNMQISSLEKMRKLGSDIFVIIHLLSLSAVPPMLNERICRPQQLPPLSVCLKLIDQVPRNR